MTSYKPFGDKPVIAFVAFRTIIFPKIMVTPGNPDDSEVFRPVVAVLWRSSTMCRHDCAAPHFQLELTHVHYRPTCPKPYTVAWLRQEWESTSVRGVRQYPSSWLQIGYMAICKTYLG